MNLVSVKQALKKQDTPAKRAIVAAYRGLETTRLPPLPILHDALPAALGALGSALSWCLMRAYWRPIFARQLMSPPRRLNLYGWGVPHTMGALRISMGEDCRLSTQVTLAGRTWSQPTPELVIGNNVGISWAQSIFVGRRVVLGHNVRIGGQGTLVGYPGHPIDPDLRAAGAPDTDGQVGDIIIGDDAWLGRGVTVNAGVRIGRAAIIASGAVVTRDIPAGVLAAGVPARVVKVVAPDRQHAPTLTDLLPADDPGNAQINVPSDARAH